MRVAILALIAIAACSYAPQRASGDAPADDDASPPIDAAFDAPVVVDAVIDAPPFDPATDCPIGYDIVLGGLTSRYRAILVDADWPTHHADCANDLADKTHMIVFDSATELQMLGTQGTFRFLVGYFQMASQEVDGNWFAITGEVVPSERWLGGQPNDNDDFENAEQDRAFINFNTGAGTQDGPASFAANGMCECDGKPIPPAIAAML